MRTWLLGLLQRAVARYDPAWPWCGGCGDLSCEDCWTEWERNVVRVSELAKDMFMRQAASYDADGSLVELAWVDPEVRAFWITEATAVLEFLGEL